MAFRFPHPSRSGGATFVIGCHFNTSVVIAARDLAASENGPCTAPSRVVRSLRHAARSGRSIGSMSATGSPLAVGRVLQVNVSGGGVPKIPVERAWVSRFGLTGDAHDEVTVHGGPHKAVCLFGIEVIERLQSEGHPVEPGSVGGEPDDDGVEWSLMPVGTRARIGDTLEIELASRRCRARPEAQLPRWPLQQDIDRDPPSIAPVCRVLTDGEVRPGDPITVLPPVAGSVPPTSCPEAPRPGGDEVDRRHWRRAEDGSRSTS